MIAISTAYKEALIAVDIEGKKAFRSLDGNAKHTESIMPALDELLDSTGKTLSQNDTYAVVIGPGSFTGIRIGIALIKGLQAGQRKKLIALTTFDLMAYCYVKENNPKKDFITVINALSGLYYICKYNSLGERIEEPRIVTQEEYQDLQETKVGLSEEGFAEILVRPSPEELLLLCEQLQQKKSFVEDKDLTPLYLRKSQAEDNLNDAKGGKNKN